MARISDIMAYVACASGSESAHGYIGEFRMGLGAGAIVVEPVRRARTLGCGGVYVDSLGGKDVVPSTGEARFSFARLYSAHRGFGGAGAGKEMRKWVTDAVELLPGVLNGWNAVKLAYLGNPWGDVRISSERGMRSVVILEWTLDYMQACGFNAVGIDALATMDLELSGQNRQKPFGLATLEALCEKHGLHLYCEGPPPRTSTWLHHLPAICGTTQLRPWREGRSPWMLPLDELPDWPGSIVLHNGPAVDAALDRAAMPDQLVGLVDLAVAFELTPCIGLEWTRDPAQDLRLET